MVSIESHLLGIQFTIESAAYLRIAVAIEAEDSQVVQLIVSRVIVNMVYLNRLALTAHTAGAIRQEQDACRQFSRYGNAFLLHFLTYR
jgi:hypothetical protein